jgi:hypothetical protein
MAEIHAEKAVVETVARQLVKLAYDQNDVSLTHGPKGIVFVVPDELAERWADSVDAENAKEEVAPEPEPVQRLTLPAKRKAKANG